MAADEFDAAVREQLQDPETAESLARLIRRAGEMEQLVQRLVEGGQAAEGWAATAADMLDEQCGRVNQTGVSLEQRLGALGELFLRITEPNVVAAIGRLVERLPQLEEASRLLEEAPSWLAIAADVIDERAAELRSQGVDLEKSISQGLRALLWLGCRVSEEELERLGYLLRSDVLDPHALEVVGRAASSLAKCQRETCEQETPPRVGLLGLLRAIGDPNVQRTLGFAMRFARCFGAIHDERPPGSSGSR